MPNPNLANINYSYHKSEVIVANTIIKPALQNLIDSNLLLKVNSIIGFNSNTSNDGRIIVTLYQEETKLSSNIVNTVIPFSSNVFSILPFSTGLNLTEGDYITTFSNISNSINLIINYDELSEFPPKRIIEYVVIAGGGGGGRYNGGGGGAGGLITGAYSIVPNCNYCIVIGAGGTGGDDGPGHPQGYQGGNSIFGNSSVSLICAYGGGGGGGAWGTNWPAGEPGGSGGGGQNAFGLCPGGQCSHFGGNGCPGQGNHGAQKFVGADGAVSPGLAGGGGGAYSQGFRPYETCNNSGGPGGLGCYLGTNGFFCYYAGGGAGYAGTGGPGGGGNYNTSGGTNTGGGAGGQGPEQGAGQPGGSGLIMLAVCKCLPDIACAAAGLTYTIDRDSRPGFKVYRFTAGTGTVCW